MGCAEVISLSEVRARKQWDGLRQELHTRFDQWLDDLEARLPEPETTLAAVSDLVWQLRQDLTGGLTETLLTHAYAREQSRRQAPCPQCERLITARPAATRTVETMVGAMVFERPYFYCRLCQKGFYPFDSAVNLAPGRLQLDVQQAAAKTVIEMPYDEAHTFFHDLTGVTMGAERMHTLTNQVAQGLTVLDIAPSREEIEKRIAQVSAGKWRRPVVVLGIDGAFVPTRPESARGCRPGQRRSRAKRPQWKGAWRDAKGFRFYLIDEGRIVHLLSWHQVQDEAALGQALTEIKKAGVIPEDHIRLCVVCDGASWIWKHVQSLFPEARQVLDYYHCKEYLHKMAKVQYGSSQQALEWVEATLTRLYVGKIGWVLGGLRRMQATSEEAAKAIANCWEYLHAHRDRTHYRQFRRGGYPLGSGGIESSNKFICHGRLKRSGAWWYESNGNQMLALRCAKYNGTFNQVFERHQQRLREA
jgi:hypothetical protein